MIASFLCQVKLLTLLVFELSLFSEMSLKGDCNLNITFYYYKLRPQNIWLWMFLFCSSGGLDFTKEDLDGFQVQKSE